MKRKTLLITLIVLLVLVSSIFLVGCEEKYSVVFNPDNGDDLINATYEKGALLKEPTIPVKEGYTFLGWYVGEQKWDFENNAVGKDLVLKAKWEKNATEENVIVTFILDNGEENIVREIEKGAFLPIDVVPEKEGYQFMGWLDSNGSPFLDIEAINEDITLTAWWVPTSIDIETKVSVTLNANNGTNNVVKEIVSGSTFGSLNIQNPVKDGFTFLGWYNGTTKYTNNTIITEDVTLLAKWEVIEEPTKVFVTIDQGDGSISETKQVAIGSTFGSLNIPDPVKEGYIFLGWFDNNDVRYLSTTTITKNVTLTAKWSIQQFTITFDDANGNIQTKSVNYGTAFGEIEIEDPIKDGHVFVGWYENDNEYKEYTEITKNVTLTAKWLTAIEVQSLNSWGDGMKLIAKMNEKGWFGNNWGGMNHEVARNNWVNGEALFMVEGSWSKWDAKGFGDNDTSNERMLMPMPSDVPENWIYDGSPAGKGEDTIVGGYNSGWMISRKAWNDPIKKEAAMAFIHTMTDKGLINNVWAKDYVNPASDSNEINADNLVDYSCAKMAKSENMITAMDFRLSPNAMTSLRALTTTTTSTSDLTNALATIRKTNALYYTPYLTYEAPTSRGDKSVADISSTISATLEVTTMFGGQDWQAYPYDLALNGGECWGYDNTANCLKTKYPNITINRSDYVIDNAVKDAMNTRWKDPKCMPDVLAWFSDSQGAVIRDDEHLVSVAEIQAEYGDYGTHLNAQHFDKYALPITGTFETMYVNVKLLAGLEGFEDIKVLYDDYQASIIADDPATKDINEYSADNTKKVALYDAVKTKLSTWTNLEMACEGAIDKSIIPFSQDRSVENNYIVDQAILIMSGKENFSYVPGHPVA